MKSTCGYKQFYLTLGRDKKNWKTLEVKSWKKSFEWLQCKFAAFPIDNAVAIYHSLAIRYWSGQIKCTWGSTFPHCSDTIQLQQNTNIYGLIVNIDTLHLYSQLVHKYVWKWWHMFTKYSVTLYACLCIEFVWENISCISIDWSQNANFISPFDFWISITRKMQVITWA